MLSGISTLCFAASYSVALVLEATRLWFRSGVRGAVMLAFAAAGLLAHTLFLAYRAWTAEGPPLSSAFDWYLLGAWSVACVYLHASYANPGKSIGLFLLPLVLALIGLAQFAPKNPFPTHPATQVWGAIHGIFLLIGYVAVFLGFAAGLMYLAQSYRLKRKQLPTQGLRLPSLEWLEKVNHGMIVLSAVMVTAGFLAGILLNAISHRRQLDYVPWSDPVVLKLAGITAWLIAAALFSTLYRPAQRGRKVAYLTVASFLLLASLLLVSPLLDSEHQPREESGKIAAARFKLAVPPDGEGRP